MNLRKLIAALLLLLCAHTITAQEKKDDKKWDVNNPGGPYHDISFTVSEGTWMNVDISPDGKELVFDLLGDIYTMPVTGGNAKPLRTGLAFEVQPRFSPDGNKILFTSDTGGGDNIWMMNKDGSNAVPVTKENFRLLNNGIWSPDGDYIVARKHFTSTRSAGAGELWLYHTSGGNGVQLTARKNDQQDVNEPCFSPDGRYVYYDEDMYPGGFFQYNKDPNNQVFVIKRFDREKGIVENVTGGPGSAMRPMISHDGKRMSFVRRVRTKTILFIRNLETGEEWPVYENLSKDQSEAWTIFGCYTGYAWTPDDKSIITWSNGRIIKIDVNAANQSVDIPFTCTVQQKIADAVRFSQDINPSSFTAKVIRQAITAPDGKSLIFSAVGYLWKKELPNGKPQRLTSGNDFEFEPSFAPDGKSIVYITWNDTTSGAMYTLNMQGSAKPVKITSAKAIYRTPAFSPDGKKIVFQKDNGSTELGPAFTSRPGIYIMNADGSGEKFVKDNGDRPRFSKNGDRIYYQVGDGMNRMYGSCTLDGNEERIHLKSTYGSQFIVSPDEKWIAFVDLWEVYVAAFPKTGRTIDLGSSTKDFPVKIISKDAGINLHWSADSKKVMYTLGDQYFSIPLDDRFDFIAGKPDSLFKAPEKGIDIGLTITADKPKGTLAFTHARIITMNGNEVIENGTLLVEENMIKAIGKTGDVVIPATAKQIDCAGKTIMPGFIDAHGHAAHFYEGITAQKHWAYYANLAYGVTTVHDPSANSEFVFAESELVKAGLVTGPRVFSTGTILYGADGDFKAVINSIDDARSAIRRTKAYGAFSVKSYNQPRREQNQMVLQAARELNMEVVPEGGSLFYHNLAMVIDGHTTIEHNLPVAPLFNDVLQLWKQSKTGYTPTLIVCYGALSGEYYWYQHSNVWENKKLLHFTPRNIIDARSRHRIMAPEEEYENGYMLVSKSLKKLADEGVKINLGAHGQLQGMGAHWEIWMLQQGGMSNMQALQAATINPAFNLGLDKWIGSLQQGKLADLLVMDKNPLDNIRNTESISMVMVNGRLFDADELNEIGNYNKPRTKFYWELNKNVLNIPVQEMVDED